MAIAASFATKAGWSFTKVCVLADFTYFYGARIFSPMGTKRADETGRISGLPTSRCFCWDFVWLWVLLKSCKSLPSASSCKRRASRHEVKKRRKDVSKHFYFQAFVPEFSRAPSSSLGLMLWQVGSKLWNSRAIILIGCNFNGKSLSRAFVHRWRYDVNFGLKRESWNLSTTTIGN